MRKMENDLLAYLLGIGDQEKVSCKLEQRSDSDWHNMIEQADRHKVVPLLYHRLRMIQPIESIPFNVEQELQEIYHHQSWQSIRLHYELKKILKVLGDEDIPVIVLKGAALAELVYKDIALRPMGDIDILVQPRDLLRSHRVLLREGYSSVSFFRELREHLTYDNGRAHIEVHPRIKELPNLNPWNHAHRATIASTDTLVLGKEDFFLHICVHPYRHLRKTGSVSLIWLYDIAEFLNRYRAELDWDYITETSKKHRVEGVVYSFSRLTNELFGEHIPSDVITRFGEDEIGISADEILNTRLRGSSLSNNANFAPGLPKIIRNFFIVFRMIFPCKEYMIKKYSIKRSKSFYFYYPIRLFNAIKYLILLTVDLSGYLLQVCFHSKKSDM